LRHATWTGRAIRCSHWWSDRLIGMGKAWSVTVRAVVEAFRLFNGEPPDAARMLRHFASMGR
jgi:hypothetical protein